MVALIHMHRISVIRLTTALSLAIALCSLHVPVFAQTFPELTGRVTDAAGIIPDDVEARLTEKLEAIETQSLRQVVVATIPDLQGYDIADYGYRLGREWGIGSKERDDGALLIVAPNERKVRIEVGYGLEPQLTDGLSWQIIDNDIVPRFKDDDMPGGIEAGVDAIAQVVKLTPAEAARLKYAGVRKSSSSGIGWILGLILIAILLLIFWPFIARKFGWDYSWHSGSGRTWSSSSSSGFSSRSYSSGSSFSSSRSFSGGGGSFGGGGASGSW